MCNAFVSLVLRADRRRVFRFAPIQGETARRLLPPLTPDPRLWSVIYLDETGVHEQSEAVWRVFRRLSGWWTILSLVRLIPRPVRDPVYRFIARHRYQWFGRRTSCRIPSPDEQDRFLP